MSHKSRRVPPIECPLASLGHTTSTELCHPTYHRHPLSSSPLNSMSRTSAPMLNINSNEMVYSTQECNENDCKNIENNLASVCNDYENQMFNRNGIEATKVNVNYSCPPMSYEYTNESSDNMSYKHDGNSSDGSRRITHCNERRRILAATTAELSGPTRSRPGSSRSNPLSSNAFCLDNTISCYHQPINEELLSSKSINNNEQYYLENKMRTLLLQSGSNNFQKYPYVSAECNFLTKNVNNRVDSNSPNYIRRQSSPSETSESDRYLVERTSKNSSASSINRSRNNYNYLVSNHRSASSNNSSLIEGLASCIGRISPSYDQGYHTLVSPSPSGSGVQQSASNSFRNRNKTENVFNKLPDEVCIKIFSWLDSCDLCNVSKVCKKFDSLVWQPILWRAITLKGEYINGDRALRSIFRRLSNQTRNVACPDVEKVMLSDGCRLTDKGLELLCRRCPELTHLQLQLSVGISNNALYNLVTKCTNLRHLDVSGCTQIVSIDFNHTLDPPRRLLLQFLDLTDCIAVDDIGLKIIVQNCPQLVYLYLRRCTQITDIGLKFVPSFCTALRELSVSDCANITDFGLYELAKLGATLRYLSVAKCDQVSDAGLKVIARRCYKLRYLNARGCEAVSDDSITMLAHSCPRLRALDIGKCDISDVALQALAESCPNLKKISLKSCDMITDRGVHCIAYYCRGLQHLNIQDCQITLDGYRAVKKYCKRCVIEHTNPGFC